MKLAIALVILFLAMSGTAGAVTLEITSGMVDAATCRTGCLFDALISLQGPGFNINVPGNDGIYSAFNGVSASVPPNFPPAFFFFGNVFSLPVVSVRLSFSYEPDTQLTLENTDFFPGNPPFNTTNTRGTIEPFRATGDVGAFDAATTTTLHFDLEGHGVVDALWSGTEGCVFPPCIPVNVFSVAYTFVPEPSPLVLLAIGVIGLMLARRHRRHSAH